VLTILQRSSTSREKVRFSADLPRTVTVQRYQMAPLATIFTHRNTASSILRLCSWFCWSLPAVRMAR
jgi:hypothetical protein